jgi:hypothetical protein
VAAVPSGPNWTQPPPLPTIPIKKAIDLFSKETLSGSVGYEQVYAMCLHRDVLPLLRETNAVLLLGNHLMHQVIMVVAAWKEIIRKVNEFHRPVLGKLIVTWLSNAFPVLYKARMFMNVLTRACRWSLS